VLAVALSVSGCQGPGDEPLSADEEGLSSPVEGVDEELLTDEYGVISRRIQRYRAGEIARTSERPPASLKEASAPLAPAAATNPGKVDPGLAETLAKARPDELVEVLITVAEPRPMPALPRLDPKEAREAHANQLRLASRQHAFDVERDRRFQSQRRHVAAVMARGGQLVEQHALCNCFTARVPAAAIEALAKDPEIRAVDPRFTNTVPPDANPNNDLIDGRTRINSDYYYNAGFDGTKPGYYVGVLDTGIRSSHVMFAAPDHIAFERDCTVGGTNCENTGHANWTADDDCWNHGTKTIGIITGNANVGADWRGATNAWVDSWKVYPKGCGGLDGTAVVKAFDRAVYWGDDVIVAEMQPILADTSSISAAADAAFDAGSMVIGANGNAGPGGSTVASPASAHKALGVGAYDIETLATYANQSRGPASDGRYKPDFQMPNNTESASTSCNNCVGAFGGTSGATPYGGVAAVLLRHWYDSNGMGVEPGKLYAGMIAFGNGPNGSYNNESGAGDLLMGNIYCRRWMAGSRAITTGATVDIDFATVTSQHDLQVAIWWPEGTVTHNDVDLHVVDPSGVYRASGTSGASVFEMGKVAGNLSPAGTWKLRIHGYNVPAGPQTVYYLVYHKVLGCGD